MTLVSRTWTTGNALTTDFDDFEQNTLSYVVTDTQLGPEQTKPTGIGAIYYYHTDRLGTIRNLTDATGQAIVSYEYDAFGALKSFTGTLANDFKFTGEQWDDDAGLYYLRARYYDPSTGRFVSRDPWPGVATNPASLNPYVYVENNPANLTDPSGRFAFLLVIPAAYYGYAAVGVLAVGAAKVLADNPWITRGVADAITDGAQNASAKANEIAQAAKSYRDPFTGRTYRQTPDYQVRQKVQFDKGAPNQFDPPPGPPKWDNNWPLWFKLLFLGGKAAEVLSNVKDAGAASINDEAPGAQTEPLCGR